MASALNPAIDELFAAVEQPFPRRGFNLRLAVATTVVAVFVWGYFFLFWGTLGLLLAALAVLLGVCIYGNVAAGVGLTLATILTFAIAIRFRPKRHVPDVEKRSDAPGILILPSDEPELYIVVERLCRRIHAQPPAWIEVHMGPTTAADLRTDWNGKYSLGLLIGLPVVGALNLQEFAGVLAHECAHLAHSKSLWVGAACDYFASSWRANAWGGENPFAVAMARVSDFFACLLSREMEYDAIWWEATVAGSHAAGAATRKMETVMIIWGIVEESLRSGWRPTKNDVVTMINIEANDLRQSPDRYRDFQNACERDHAKGWWDEYPSGHDRLAAITRQNAPGVFHSEAPATVLFRSFPKLCERAEEAYYENVGAAARPTMSCDTTEAESPKRPNAVTG